MSANDNKTRMVFPGGTTAVVWGKFKMVGEDGKVIHFPLPENCGVAGESMWVEAMKGDNNKDSGSFDNIFPWHCQSRAN